MCRTRITELGCKEVINVCDGTRYGYATDVEIDCSCGKIFSIIVCGGGKMASLFTKGQEYIIPWEAIKRIGDDIILVDYAQESFCERKNKLFFRK